MKRVTQFAMIVVCVCSLLSAASYSQETSVVAPDALPGVEPAMLTPTYWAGLHPDADDIIMTPQRIVEFNAENRRKDVDSPVGGDGEFRNPLLVVGLPATMPGDSLRTILDATIADLMNPGELYGSSQYYDNRNVTWDGRMKNALAAAMNVGAVPRSITRRFGIVVNHTSVRKFPTDVPGYHNTESELDRFQVTDLLIGNPVAVLHQTRDGNFYYCETHIARGWIAAENIALSTRNKVRELTERSSFLVMTTDRVPVYADRDHKIFARYAFFASTLPLESKSNAGYIVSMPVRNNDGSLGLIPGYIKPGASANEGWVPYSKRNLLNLFFGILHTPYGWHGQDDKRDCAGTLRVLFRCFGFDTGRACWTVPGIQTPMPSDLSREEKVSRAQNIEGVITIAYGPGHVVLFLGKAGNGKMYFMHQCGWGYEENDVHNYVNRVVINESSHRLYQITRPTLYTTVR